MSSGLTTKDFLYLMPVCGLGSFLNITFCVVNALSSLCPFPFCLTCQSQAAICGAEVSPCFQPFSVATSHPSALTCRQIHTNKCSGWLQQAHHSNSVLLLEVKHYYSRLHCTDMDFSAACFFTHQDHTLCKSALQPQMNLTIYTNTSDY